MLANLIRIRFLYRPKPDNFLVTVNGNDDQYLIKGAKVINY